MENVKMCERDFLNAVKEVFETGECSVEPAQMLAFVEKRFTALDNKAAKARERAAAKRAEADPLYDRIMDVLGDEPKTVAEILIALGDEDLTAGKISYRCSKLAANGDIEKTTVRLPGSEGVKARTLVAYKTCSVVAE